MAGSMDGDAFFAVAVEAVTVTMPFASGGFAGSSDAADGYLRCLQIALPGESSSWWKLERADDVPLAMSADEPAGASRTLSVVAARNAVPVVSRVCVAAANKEGDVNVRVYARLRAEAYAMYEDDLWRALAQLRIDAERAAATVGE